MEISMPWLQTDPMEQQVQFFLEYKRGDRTIVDLSKKYGISRKTAYKWLTRFREEGYKCALIPRSRARKTPLKRIDSQLESRIVGLRQQKPRWGGKKIAELLMTKYPEYGKIHASTVNRVLTRHGLITPRKRSRVKYGGIHSVQEGKSESNDIWTIDFKGDFVLGNKLRCYPLTIQDFETRFLLCCHGLSEPKISKCIDIMDLVFTEFGLPRVIHSDNGTQFVSGGFGGLNMLSDWWIKQGIMPKRSRPRHPEENPRHERMHRELKAETAKPPKADFNQQQVAFNKFRYEYNCERPHEGIEMKTPASIYTPSNRAYNRKDKLDDYSELFDVQRANNTGAIKLGRRKFQLSLALRNEPIGIKLKTPNDVELYYGPIFLGEANLQTGGMIDRTKIPKRGKHIK